MRARLSIAGTLNAQTCALLTSAIDAHLRSGRRHLRIDMTLAEAVDEGAVAALRDAQRAVAGLGGVLALDNATAQLAGRLAEDSLVSASA
ncbi:STAS domain-containing protein [uncultured Jatrophihabitans sp.]|uniref:STAS domain-containing protein n=1 Tax=uncultured Jatrophihabitans sp. TaxID=1610747 RepID=UPI0035C94FD6